jgi:hypothetical protein
MRHHLIFSTLDFCDMQVTTFFRSGIAIFCLLCCSLRVQAQEVAEHLLINSHWKYVKTVHASSGFVQHTAQNNLFDEWVRFNHDGTCRIKINNFFDQGLWHVKGQKLMYPHKMDSFTILELTNETLILECNMPGTRSKILRYFVSVDPRLSPIPLETGEMPTAFVKYKRSAKPWWKSLNPNTNPDPKLAEVPIEVELWNGGYYGGIDPVMKDFIHIKSTGRLCYEHSSHNQPEKKFFKDIQREELEGLLHFITEKGFFNMNAEYRCENDPCISRLSNKPRPIPMRLSVKYGNRHKTIIVYIWQTDDRNPRYVNYPQELDMIVDSIVRMANRPAPLR